MASNDNNGEVPVPSNTNGTESQQPETERAAAAEIIAMSDDAQKSETNATDAAKLLNGESNISGAGADDVKSIEGLPPSPEIQVPPLDGAEGLIDPREKVDVDPAGEKAESGAEQGVEAANQEMVDFKVVYNKQSFNVTFPVDATVLRLKEHIRLLTDVEVANQKIMFKGLMKDEVSLREHKLTPGSKVMVVGSKTTDIQSVNQTTSKPLKESDQAGSAASSEPLCRQKPHKAVLDKYGRPDDLMPGLKGRRDALPPTPLAGMYNKVGGKVRLTFKLENDQVWIGTKERTEKIGLTSIKAIVSEPIEGHEEYHLMGIQLGPTEASRYWIYWVPAQYVDSIKDAALGNWQYF